jgi:sugar phosphate isomerase/epimerase
MHPLALAALTVLGLAPDKQILCANKIGYQGVGIRLIPATSTEIHYPLLTDSIMRTRVKNLIQSTGVKVLDIEVFRLEANTNVKDFIPYLELGADLGAKSVLVAGYDLDWSRTKERWLELSEITEQFDIKPHIEPMPWTYVKSYLDGKRLLDETNDNWGAVLIDPIHFFRTGGSVRQLDIGFIKRARYIQLSDASVPAPDNIAEILRQGREDRLPPGMGDLPLNELIKIIPDDLPISVEIPLSKKWNLRSQEDKANFLFQHTIDFLNKIKT